MSEATGFQPHPQGWVLTLPELDRLLLCQAIEEVISLLDPPVLPFDIEGYLADRSPQSSAVTGRSMSSEKQKETDKQGKENNRGKSNNRGKVARITAGAEDEQPSPQIAWLADRNWSETSLGRLLPVASEDLTLADEFDDLTEAELRTLKSERLSVLLVEISHPSGPKPDQIFVPKGEEMTWLAGLNDVRLAISARLKISDLQRHERLLQSGELWLSQQVESGLEEVLEEEEPFVIMLYTQLYRWQDSLLTHLEDWP